MTDQASAQLRKLCLESTFEPMGSLCIDSGCPTVRLQKGLKLSQRLLSLTRGGSLWHTD